MARGSRNQKQDDDEGTPTVRRCATEQVHLRLLLEEPEYALRRAAIEDQAWRSARMGIMARSGCTRIPVVVHVVHRTATENISEAQIESQIEILNDDFRRKNADVSSVPAVFQPLVADARIHFALATTDPAGNPTDGITRTSTSVNGFSHDDTVKSAATGGADPWPSDRYLNIWVCRLAGGLLGYAQFPGGPAATDGVVVTHTGFGNTGTAAAPFNRGRTTVHEIGHWLNLRHIWGDDGNGCSGSDFVDDTPNQAGANTGMPTFPRVTCGNGPNGDLFVNYMDYTDDAGMMMFTAGQVTRMQAALDGPRSSVGTPVPCEGVKLKFADEPVTLKFRDDLPTLKFRDDPVTLKFRDDPGTLKSIDDPGKLKFRDDIATSKALDDVKSPALDKHPGSDVFVPPVNPGQPAPFVLATPHHSQAWEQTYPGAAPAPDPTLAAYEAQLAQYEQALQVYAEAESAGVLTPGEERVLQRLYDEYAQLGAEYQRLTGLG